MYRKNIVLKELKLVNVALIEIIEINFEKGLNVFTGESGSGKSLILDSLNSLFGGSNIPLNHLIRPDKSECLIQAKFECSQRSSNWLIKKGYKDGCSSLVITRRSFKNNNKVITKYFLNDFQVSKKNIESLGLLLIDFAGQADSFIFSSQDHLKTLIDELAFDKLNPVNNEIKKRWEEINFLKKEIQIKNQQIQQQEENDFASTKLLKILEDAKLTSDSEISDLKAKEIKLANYFELNNIFRNVLSNLSQSNSDSSSVISLIGDSIKQLNKATNYDPSVVKFLDQLILLQNEIDHLIYALSEFFDLSDGDPKSLEDAQRRLYDLQKLEKTFSLQLPELITKRNELRNSINFNSQKYIIKELHEKLCQIEKKFSHFLNIQTSLRQEIANKIESSVISTLDNLGLNNALFKIKFERVKPRSDGQDNISFLFSANPDQPLAPISKVISGGEMSRFLLALKATVSNIQNTLFFDEIDNGLSGKSLVALITLIKKLSNSKQILCITHQPLLAASAKAHFKVEKVVKDGLTYTSMVKLESKKQRQTELVELIGGTFIEANDYASTLIDKAAA